MACSRVLESRVQTRVIFTGIAIITFMSAILLASSVAPPGGECETRFMQGLFTCFHDHRVPFNTYLWAVGNHKGGVPPDNETVFRQQMCSVENDVVKCVLDSLHALVDTVHCHSAEGMETLLTVQVRAIFEEYDNYCAHDCRQTLELEMRECFQNLTLDSSRFLSPSSDGALLGDTPSSAAEFCNNSDALMTCLRKQRDECPESPRVMKKLGLDLKALNTGFEILCRQQEAYLSSLECFGKQTRAVEKCQEDHALTLMRLVSKAKVNAKVKVTQLKVTKGDFLSSFCLARVQFIKCDLQAWAEKPNEECNGPALALKRDIHCSQIPAECGENMPGPVEKVCTYNWAATNLPSSEGQAEMNPGTGGGRGLGRSLGELASVLLFVMVGIVSVV
ncbi:hypothetical protein ACOMHN_059906 [Nucella lapillus]